MYKIHNRGGDAFYMHKLAQRFAKFKTTFKMANVLMFFQAKMIKIAWVVSLQIRTLRPQTSHAHFLASKGSHIKSNLGLIAFCNKHTYQSTAAQTIFRVFLFLVSYESQLYCGVVDVLYSPDSEDYSTRIGSIAKNIVLLAFYVLKRATNHQWFRRYFVCLSVWVKKAVFRPQLAQSVERTIGALVFGNKIDHSTLKHSNTLYVAKQIKLWGV